MSTAFGSGQGKLDEDGCFFSTIENIEEHTTLSGHKQRNAINKLKELGILEIKVKGIPAKRYLKINEQELLQFFNGKLLKNLTTSSEEIEQQVSENFNGNNNINNNNINNNIYLSLLNKAKEKMNEYNGVNFGKVVYAYNWAKQQPEFAELTDQQQIHFQNDL